MGMNDRLLIKNLLVRGIVGINTWDREHRQDILLNLEVFVDTARAARSDDIEDSLNYRSLTKAIISLVDESSFRLVEALAHSIAAMCVREFGADRVRLRVEKPGALRFAESVGVEIERDAADFD